MLSPITARPVAFVGDENARLRSRPNPSRGAAPCSSDAVFKTVSNKLNPLKNVWPMTRSDFVRKRSFFRPALYVRLRSGKPGKQKPAHTAKT
jgi:hypothetical protein